MISLIPSQGPSLSRACYVRHICSHLSSWSPCPVASFWKHLERLACAARALGWLLSLPPSNRPPCPQNVPAGLGRALSLCTIFTPYKSLRKWEPSLLQAPDEETEAYRGKVAAKLRRRRHWTVASFLISSWCPGQEARAVTLWLIELQLG